MKTIYITLAILGFFVLFIGSWLMGTYNGLVQKDVAVETAWSQVETQYQRRFDLVPQLVGATRGILEQEREIMTAIAEARTRYAGSSEGSREDQIEAYGEYESVIGRLMLIYENYPTIATDDEVRALMDELTGTENRVAVARTRYNESVEGLNISLRHFPTNMIGDMFGFDEAEYFTSTEGSDLAPEVNLSL